MTFIAMDPIGTMADIDHIVNIKLTDARKESIARLMQFQPLAGLMVWGVRLFVPRHRVGVSLIAFNADEEVLLLRHAFHTSIPWGLPGGWLGRNEAPGEGLRRELHEETGLSIRLGPVVHTAHESVPSQIIMAYLGWVNTGPIRLNSEIIEARWFGLGQLPQPLRPFTEAAIAAGISFSRMINQSTDPTMVAAEAD